MIIKPRLQLLAFIILGSFICNIAIANISAQQMEALKSNPALEVAIGLAAHSSAMQIENESSRRDMLATTAFKHLRLGDAIGARGTLADARTLSAPDNPTGQWVTDEIAALSVHAGEAKAALEYVNRLPDNDRIQALGWYGAAQAKEKDKVGTEQTIQTLETEKNKNYPLPTKEIEWREKLAKSGVPTAPAPTTERYADEAMKRIQMALANSGQNVWPAPILTETSEIQAARQATQIFGQPAAQDNAGLTDEDYEKIYGPYDQKALESLSVQNDPKIAQALKLIRRSKMQNQAGSEKTMQQATGLLGDPQLIEPLIYAATRFSPAQDSYEQFHEKLKQHDLSGAMTIIHDMPDSGSKDAALTQLSRTYAEAGQLGHSFETAKQINSPYQRAFALQNLIPTNPLRFN